MGMVNRKLFSAGGEIRSYPEMIMKQKGTLPKFLPVCIDQALSIHCVLHDVDRDGDLDFVGSFVRGVFLA